MSAGGIDVRRVGFREGTDAELAAMHLVESEIEAERQPGRATQPLESYLAFARSLPTQFDDHTWLAEDRDGTPVGCSACWSNAAGDPAVMECYVDVRPGWRRQGVGWRLVQPVVDAAVSEGRLRLIWTTSDLVPAGEVMSLLLGGRRGRVHRNSELRLDEVDWPMVQSWIDDGPIRASTYGLEIWEGPFPPHLRQDAATFHHIMQTAPRDDLAIGDVVLDEDHVAELDRNLAETGRQRWTIFVRDPEGACVGGTEVTFDSWDPDVVHQQNTGIDPAHRGQGLAKWAKGVMLARVREQLPAVRVIRTGNAFSNEPMLAINNALGFEVVEVRTEWQGEVKELAAHLGLRAAS